ncbi:hypothetical protein LBMAG21_15680 [Armatimonadota bacterium]|nr:hypothetical protein LBMAG21_15680 [Armatimonadota bacterium]
MKRVTGWVGVALLWLCSVMALAQGGSPKMIGMYVHQHWPYKRPYAARTWTLEDWRGYTTGLKALGFNTILMWPMLETVPEPLMPSDKANLEKLSRVIDMLHNEQGMRVYIVICPNIVARQTEARKATFQKRHYYYCEDLVNPADPVAMQKMIAWREKLVQPLKNVDGVAIIDSDPGGYPNSTIAEFVNLLGEHRKMLNRVRPGIELLYWMHAGWRGWGRLYEKGKLDLGKPAEYEETLQRLMALNPEPWGMANGLEYARKQGVAEKVISFNYGRIEGEPSFPCTNFTGANAYEGAKSDAPRGVMGNAQTHCVQLPNTFAFARGAQGLPLSNEEYVTFADRLITGQGATIAEAWNLLNSSDAKAQRAMAAKLDGVSRRKLQTGDLQGLLFGSAKRFLTDIAMMLRYRAAIAELADAVKSGAAVKSALKRLIEDGGAWQARHGYENNWYEPRMLEALHKIGSPSLREALAVTYEVQHPVKPGETAFEEIRQNFARIETYTPRLLAAMRKTLEEMEAKE